jgi:branched-chain amino acid transport system permease protein
VQEAIQLIVLGVLLGGVYAVIGLGLSLSFGVLRLINLAHGHFVLLSAYLAFLFITNFGFDLPLIMPINCAIMFIIGYALHKGAINRVLRASSEAVIILTFGVAIIIENALMAAFSPMTKSLRVPYTLLSFDVMGYKIPLSYLMGFIVAVVVAICLKTFLDRTFVGVAIKAVAQDPGACSLLGINSERVRGLAFALSLMIASVAGVIFGLVFPFTPSSGTIFLIYAFGIIVIGGVGSILGTFVGGVILAMTQVISGYYAHGWSTFFGYLLILSFLAFKPKGIWGK